MSKLEQGRKYIEEKVRFNQLFNPKSKTPETEKEIFEMFLSLTSELSPENLHCDGEISPKQAAKKRNEILAGWAYLESLLGRKVSDHEVYQAVTA
jgi:hypothetical protein